MGSSALIANIQGYSIHDGPGIRTVVFLKGCPLRCRWCANPENLEDRVRVGFLANLCKHCGRCAKVCPQGAILPDADRRIDREKCDECAKCVEACFYGALIRYGKGMTAEEVFDQVLAGEMLGQPVLVFADRPKLALDALVILEAAVLRVNVAVIQLLNKVFHIVSPSLF